jgi:hypothetical protein
MYEHEDENEILRYIQLVMKTFTYEQNYRNKKFTCFFISGPFQTMENNISPITAMWS